MENFSREMETIQNNQMKALVLKIEIYAMENFAIWV